MYLLDPLLQKLLHELRSFRSLGRASRTLRVLPAFSTTLGVFSAGGDTSMDFGNDTPRHDILLVFMAGRGTSRSMGIVFMDDTPHHFDDILLVFILSGILDNKSRKRAPDTPQYFVDMLLVFMVG